MYFLLTALAFILQLGQGVSKTVLTTASLTTPLPSGNNIIRSPAFRENVTKRWETIKSIDVDFISAAMKENQIKQIGSDIAGQQKLLVKLNSHLVEVNRILHKILQHHNKRKPEGTVQSDPNRVIGHVCFDQVVHKCETVLGLTFCWDETEQICTL